MILCVGEILVDMIAQENKGSISYLRKAGGAPFNVACAISKVGIDSVFVGSVGEDTIGKFLCSFIKKQNLKDYFIEFVNYECKYRGCLHDKEPHCGIKEAVENGLVKQEDLA